MTVFNTKEILLINIKQNEEKCYTYKHNCYYLKFFKWKIKISDYYSLYEKDERLFDFKSYQDLVDSFNKLGFSPNSFQNSVDCLYCINNDKKQIDKNYELEIIFKNQTSMKYYFKLKKDLDIAVEFLKKSNPNLK